MLRINRAAGATTGQEARLSVLRDTLTCCTNRGVSTDDTSAWVIEAGAVRGVTDATLSAVYVAAQVRAEARPGDTLLIAVAGDSKAQVCHTATI